MSKFAHSVPIEDIDKLLIAAQPDYMVYCIITLLYLNGIIVNGDSRAYARTFYDL